jgi:hypothetical protein
MLPAAENNAISDSDPRSYLVECAHSLSSHSEEVFSSNLLPLLSRFDYDRGRFQQFTRERSNLIADLVRRLCDGEGAG